MDFKLVGPALGPRRLEDFVQRPRRMGIEIIHNQHDLLSVGIDIIDQVLDNGGEVHHSPAIRDRHLAPAAQRLAQREQGTHATEVRWELSDAPEKTGTRVLFTPNREYRSPTSSVKAY